MEVKKITIRLKEAKATKFKVKLTKKRQSAQSVLELAVDEYLK